MKFHHYWRMLRMDVDKYVVKSDVGQRTVVLHEWVWLTSECPPQLNQTRGVGQQITHGLVLKRKSLDSNPVIMFRRSKYGIGLRELEGVMYDFLHGK